jgi:hypothetical protein
MAIQSDLTVFHPFGDIKQYAQIGKKPGGNQSGYLAEDGNKTKCLIKTGSIYQNQLGQPLPVNTQSELMNVYAISEVATIMFMRMAFGEEVCPETSLVHEETTGKFYVRSNWFNNMSPVTETDLLNSGKVRKAVMIWEVLGIEDCKPDHIIVRRESEKVVDVKMIDACRSFANRISFPENFFQNSFIKKVYQISSDTRTEVLKDIVSVSEGAIKSLANGFAPVNKKWSKIIETDLLALQDRCRKELLLH